MTGATRKTPNAIDSHIGRRVRTCRKFAGLSQEKLGKALGITFQQVQKYERGVNRIGASRLYQIADILGVPVAFFFEGAPLQPEAEAAAPAIPVGETAFPGEAGKAAEQEMLDLLRAWREVADPDERKRLMTMVRTAGRTARPRKAQGCG